MRTNQRHSTEISPVLVIAFPLFFIKALKRFYVILMSAVDGCSGSINRMEIKKCGEQRISGEQLKTLSHRALLMESTFRKHCRRKGKNTRAYCIANIDVLFVLHGRLFLSFERSFSFTRMGEAE